MNISHVIRGDDHKINAIKQIILFQYMGWKIPKYFHIPLIHSSEEKNYLKETMRQQQMIIKKLVFCQ